MRLHLAGDALHHFDPGCLQGSHLLRIVRQQPHLAYPQRCQHERRKLELQRGMNTGSLVTAKATIAGVGWLIAMLPAISAIPLWKWYGGAVYPPEMFALIGGHILNAGLTIALGAASTEIFVQSASSSSATHIAMDV